MKKIIAVVAVLFLFVTNASAQTTDETLTNNTIIKFAKIKLGKNLIVNKINQSKVAFDVSTDGMISLKENGVADEVIEAMIARQQQSQGEQRDNTITNGKSSIQLEESGIYVMSAGELVGLDPTIVSVTQPKSGLLDVKYKSQIEGGEANYRFASTDLKFYFNFEPVKKNLNSANANATVEQNNYMNQLLNKMTLSGSNANYQAISPNDFKLLKLVRLKNKREFTAGKVSMMGQVDMSIDDKSLVPFKYKKISATTFEVIPSVPLKPGEYCFYYLGNNNNTPYLQLMGHNNTKVFDFGVK